MLLGSGVEHAPYYTHSPDIKSDATERKPPEATAERQKHKEKEGLPQRTQRLGVSGVSRVVQSSWVYSLRASAPLEWLYGKGSIARCCQSWLWICSWTIMLPPGASHALMSAATCWFTSTGCER